MILTVNEMVVKSPQHMGRNELRFRALVEANLTLHGGHVSDSDRHVGVLVPGLAGNRLPARSKKKKDP